MLKGASDMKNSTIKHKLSGFTLVEVITVVACVAVIASLSFGDMNRMFVKQIEENEALDLQYIQKALEIYAKREGSLPLNNDECDTEEKSTPSQWHMQLAKYSDMSANRICFDQFGHKREYQSDSKKQNYRNGQYEYEVFYASILSRGNNHRVAETTPWVGENGYQEFEAAEDSDDLVIKYNDNDYKLSLYEETLERVSTLEKYLERYARSKRSVAKSIDEPEFDNLIFYPKDGRSTDAGAYFTNSDGGVKTIDDELSAVALTKELGLPEYVGRNAITGKSMWYISNPGPDRSNPCDNAKTTPPYYPPAIIVTTGDVRPNGC